MTLRLCSGKCVLLQASGQIRSKCHFFPLSNPRFVWRLCGNLNMLPVFHVDIRNRIKLVFQHYRNSFHGCCDSDSYRSVILFTGSAPLFFCHSINNEWNALNIKKKTNTTTTTTTKMLSLCLPELHPDFPPVYFFTIINNNLWSSHLLWCFFFAGCQLFKRLIWKRGPLFLPQIANSLCSPKRKCVVCVVSSVRTLRVDNMRSNQTRRDEVIQWRQRREHEVTWLLCLQTTVCSSSACCLKLRMCAWQAWSEADSLFSRCIVQYNVLYSFIQYIFHSPLPPF